MKVLLIHNKYQFRGGEDIVIEQEKELLEKHNNQIKIIYFDNSRIINVIDKFIFGLNSIFNISSRRKIKRIIENFEPDIIHVHNFFPIASPSIFWEAKRNNIPIILTLHNFRLICANALLFRNDKICIVCKRKLFLYPALIFRCYRNSFIGTIPLCLMLFLHKIIQTWENKVTYFITLSKFAKDTFLGSNMNINNERYFVKSNFTIDYGKGDSKRNNFFIYVGRLSNEKGIKILFEVLLNIEVSIKVIGTGPLENEVKKIASRNRNLLFLGFRKHEECIDEMKKCKAVLFPSLCYENFGMSIIEAFSTGTPVICSDIGSQAEIDIDNYNGLHFKSGDSEDLANKIKLFVSDDFSSKHLYRNARKTYLEKYTPEKNYEQLVSIYDKAIEKNRDKKNW